MFQYCTLDVRLCVIALLIFYVENTVDIPRDITSNEFGFYANMVGVQQSQMHGNVLLRATRHQ